MLFASSSAALCAEKTAREEGIVVKLILTPRRFSASCAICLRFCQTARNRLEAAMHDRGFSHEGVHLLEDKER